MAGKAEKAKKARAEAAKAKAEAEKAKGKAEKAKLEAEKAEAEALAELEAVAKAAKLAEKEKAKVDAETDAEKAAKAAKAEAEAEKAEAEAVEAETERNKAMLEKAEADSEAFEAKAKAVEAKEAAEKAMAKANRLQAKAERAKTKNDKAKARVAKAKANATATKAKAEEAKARLGKKASAAKATKPALLDQPKLKKKVSCCLISYAPDGKKSKLSQARLHNLSEGFDKHIKYDKAFLHKTEFVDRHVDLYDGGMRDAYQAWLAYLILNAMEDMEDGDIVVYSDVGHLLDHDAVSQIKSRLNNGYFIILTPMKQIMWTKRDCFFLMDCLDEKYLNAQQVNVGCCAFQKNKKVMDFLAEWLKWSTNYEVVSDHSVHKREIKGIYKEHRWVQSILSNLVVKHSTPTIPMNEVTSFIHYMVPLNNRVKGRYAN